MPTDWDARAYHQVSDPQFSWGLKVLERLSLRGDETVLDAGCGSGRLTAVLLSRLPTGRVIALDRSEGMLDQARQSLGAHPRVSFQQADLAALSLDSAVDAVFSTATFHWVPDHDALFRGLFRALRPGGALVAQCGGGANLHRVRERAAALMQTPRFGPFFQDWTEAWTYADPEATAARLSAAGFTGVRVWLEEAPTPFTDQKAYEAFLRGVVLRLHLAALPGEAERAAFLAPILEAALGDRPPLTLDYWRLNLDARRP